MRIWLLTSEFPPDSGGGISTYCSETVNMLSAKGHAVTVFTQDFSLAETKEEITKFGKLVRFNPNNSYTVSFLGYEANLSYAFAEIVKTYLLKDQPPDVIESQEYLGIAYYLLQFKNLGYKEFKDLKILITLHSPSFLYLEYNKVNYHRLPYYWVGEMEKSCIAGADMLISPSHYLVSEIKKRMTISNDVYVVRNPYQIDNTPQSNSFNRNKIVFFGKLTPQKGCLELLCYFKELWGNGLTHALTMIGGGAHLYHPEGIDMIDYVRREYSQEIKSGLLKLQGSIQPNELNKFLLDAHIILVPSIVDNLPYTVLEAMGRGRILLASVQGGQSEVISHKSNGFLFTHEEKHSFKEQLHTILNLSEPEIQAVSQKAKIKILNDFSHDTIYKTKIDLLLELTKLKQTERFPFIRQTEIKEPIQLTTTENSPLLSVVIPYYNMGRFIHDAINSIKASKYFNIEVIIVNDGSTDVKSTMVLEALEKECNIKILNQPNQGLASARNAGALLANGEYLAFLDPDDTIVQDYYAKAIEVLKKYENVYFVGCWAKYFGESKKYWPAFNPEPPYILFHNMINSSALIYKKEVFLKYGLNEKDMIFGMEDYDSVIKLVKNGYNGVVLPEPLWNYRIRKNSMARKFTDEKQLYLYRLLSNKHSDFYADHASEIVNLLNANGSGIKFDNPTLIHGMSGLWIGNKFAQKIIAEVKSRPLLRKIALQIKKQIKKR